jgi:hypothetical protein
LTFSCRNDENIDIQPVKHHKSVTFREYPTITSCDCKYQIVSASFPLPPGNENFQYDLISGNDCDGSFCGYFTGGYNTDLACVSGIDPNCYDVFTQVVPPVAYPFNCEIPPYSIFNVYFDAIAFNEDCGVFGFTYFPEASITYRIMCTPKPELPPCNGCPNQDCYMSYTSPDITYTISGERNWDRRDIQLTGCGCKPEPL